MRKKRNLLENIHFALYLGRNISYAGKSFMKSFLTRTMTIMGFSVDLGTLGSDQKESMIIRIIFLIDVIFIFEV